MAQAIRWLNAKLAPCIQVHGVLVDIYGEGVLITGESGIGKSEAAIELIKRGHRLVSDDAVLIRKVSEDTLIGSAPEVTKHLIEIRGIGIVDVKQMFGVSSVKDDQEIDLVIKLKDWSKDQEYDRMGLEEEYTEYLGNRVVSGKDYRSENGKSLVIKCDRSKELSDEMLFVQIVPDKAVEQDACIVSGAMIEYCGAFQAVDLTDGIRQIEVSADAEIYDILGRRLKEIPDEKGLYIINGRKVLIK
jgi:hypothetical protein